MDATAWSPTSARCERGWCPSPSTPSSLRAGGAGGAAAAGDRGAGFVFARRPLTPPAAGRSPARGALPAPGGGVAPPRRREPAWVADLLAARRVTLMWTVPTTYLLL